MNNRILLMSQFNQESFQLKDIMIRHLKQNVDWVRTPQQALHALLHSPKYGAVLINTKIFTRKKMEMVDQLRAIGCQSPVLYIADLIHADGRFPIPHSKKTLVVEKPISTKELQGIIERTQKLESYLTRYNKRFSTIEKAKVEIFRNGEIFECSLRNLSMGGAFIATDRSFLAGEVLKIHIPLDQVERAHEMSGKVIWNSHNPNYKTQTPGVGVRFIKTGEVYSEALQTL
ncbi:MAG: PilZ domain-containing protein [Bdellovibrionales bacterium]